MWGFSKKRFFLTLGLSILIWLVSGAIQAMVGFSDYFKISHACSLTGYPIAFCISNNDIVKVTIGFKGLYSATDSKSIEAVLTNLETNY